MKIGHFLSIFFTSFFFVLSLKAMSSYTNTQESNNELHNISKKERSSSKNIDIFANFIFWTAKEAGTDNWAEVITSDSSSISNEIRQVHFRLDPGFKVGVCYKMKHDKWDTKAYYTWFQTKGKDSISREPGTVHSTFLGNFYVDNEDGTGLSGPSYQKANIGWTIHFNMIDLELGRNFWINKLLAIRIFVGIKGGSIKQFIHSKWQNPDLPIDKYFNIGIENLKNNYWGIGPEAGINTKWNLFNAKTQFYLFGDFSVALMWGHWSFEDVFQNDISQQVSVDLQDINGGSSMVRTFMGFGWNSNFRKNKYKFSAKLGYEMQFWLDQLQYYSFTGGRLVNELTLQGGTVEFYFNF